MARTGLRSRKLPSGFWKGAGKMGRYKKSAAKKSVAPTTAFAKKVMKVVNRNTETKYVSSIVAINQALTSAAVTPLNFLGLIPPVGQGVQDHQRIGDQLKPLFARSVFTYYMNNTNVTYDVTVNLVIVMVKGASTAAAVAAVPAGALLKVGNGTLTDPNDPNQVNQLSLTAHYPINSEQYTLCKWYKKRFAKGPGALNSPPTGAESGQLANTPSQQVIKYKWKPPTLKYDPAPGLLPQNHYPVYVTWATANDGTALQVPALFYSCRSEMYFKDA